MSKRLAYVLPAFLIFARTAMAQDPFGESAKSPEAQPSEEAASDLVWDAWRDRIKADINRRFHAIADLAFSQNRMLWSSVEFSVSKDGRIFGSKLLKSSGDQIFDDWVLAVVNSTRENITYFPPGSRDTATIKMGLKAGNASRPYKDEGFSQWLQQAWLKDSVNVTDLGSSTVSISFDASEAGLESSFVRISSGSDTIDNLALTTLKKVLGAMAVPSGPMYRYNADFSKEHVAVHYVGRYWPGHPDAYERYARDEVFQRSYRKNPAPKLAE